MTRPPPRSTLFPYTTLFRLTTDSFAHGADASSIICANAGSLRREWRNEHSPLRRVCAVEIPGASPQSEETSQGSGAHPEGARMKPVERVLSTGILLSFALCVAWLPQSGASSGAQTGAVGVPAYHMQVPDGPLPATLSPKQFSEPKIQ